MGTAFAKFMASASGRVIRIAAGVALIALGYSLASGPGFVLMAVGVLPVLAGALNFCAIAPLIRAPFWGRDAVIVRTPASRRAQNA